MNNWIAWSLIGSALALAAIVAFVGYRGFRSGLRPFLIFRTGWALAINRCWAVPRTVLGIALVIASGAGLQLLFVNWHVLDERALLFASIGWQAVMATGIAMLAVPLHLSIIHDFLAARRFGSDTYFYRGDSVNQSLHARPPSVSLLLRAGAFGFLFWLLSYGLNVASNAVIFLAPESLRALVPEIVQFVRPDFVRLIVFLGVGLASFLIMTLVSLVRPALSLGSRRPFLFGISMAVGNVSALYLVTALLLILPALMGPLVRFVPAYFLGATEIAGGVGDLLFVIFSVFQTLAVEATTVLFMNRAMNQSAGADEFAAATDQTQSAA